MVLNVRGLPDLPKKSLNRGMREAETSLVYRNIKKIVVRARYSLGISD